jgi:hypothetical protein
MLGVSGNTFSRSGSRGLNRSQEAELLYTQGTTQPGALSPARDSAVTDAVLEFFPGVVSDTVAIAVVGTVLVMELCRGVVWYRHRAV